MHQSKLLKTVFALTTLTAALTAQAASPSCNNITGVCTLDVGKATAIFTAHQPFVGGYLALANADAPGANANIAYGGGSFPNTMGLVGGAGKAGFSFDPGAFASSGGSGFEGGYGADFKFDFDDVSFAANAGYVLDSITFKITGSSHTEGNGTVTLDLPGAASYVGDNFSAQQTYTLGTFKFGAGGDVFSRYESNPDGSAKKFGTASLSFDKVEIWADLHSIRPAVPEPTTWLMSLAGLMGLAAVARRRKL